MFLTKKQFDEQVEIFKGLLAENIYGILKYNEDEIDNWLVDYFIKNQDIEEVVYLIEIDRNDLSNINSCQLVQQQWSI